MTNLATTSFLYHSHGLVGYDHHRTEYLNGWTYFHVSLKKYRRRCKNCGARWHHLKMDGTFERTFFAVPCGLRPQFLVLRGHRQRCLKCGKSLREPVLFAQGQKRHTKGFARYVVAVCGLLPLKKVADQLGVGWDMVKEIHKEYLAKKWGKRKLSKVRYVAIDEFAVQKGHKYMTVVMDLETGAILHVREGKSADSVKAFLQKLKRVARIEAIAADMSGAFKAAVTEVFGRDFDLVHDPYHVVGLASKAIDCTRRGLVRAAEADAKKVIKGTRFLLLRGMENLSEKGLARMVELMRLNEPLYQAYLLKEDLRTFWSVKDTEAEPFLKRWLAQARSLGNKHFTKLADTLERHRDGLLCYFKHRISTGPLEGLNNKIKVLKRMAYGYRDRDYFKLRLYDLHEEASAVF
jgi:transposase